MLILLCLLLRLDHGLAPGVPQLFHLLHYRHHHLQGIITILQNIIAMFKIEQSNTSKHAHDLIFFIR